MKIKITNKTYYNTSDFRKIIRQCCKDLCIKDDKLIIIQFSSKNYIHGIAHLGSRVREHHLSFMYVPEYYVNAIDFARVMKHELMHNIGIDHKDMTREQRLCNYGSNWAYKYSIRKVFKNGLLK